MGFDLSGLSPNVTRPMPELPKFVDRTEEQWEEYHKWQEENCGTYFRNNIWWWRQLWSYVSATCNDILTEKDIEHGSFNDGHKISKTKANRIAKRLWGLINNGQVKEYEEGYKVHLDSLDEDDRRRSYPFNEENVRAFANFCANSGGFTIS
mgnify:CR=1 FL=1